VIRAEYTPNFKFCKVDPIVCRSKMIMSYSCQIEMAYGLKSRTVIQRFQSAGVDVRWTLPGLQLFML
jgi:hypothetical protein